MNENQEVGVREALAELVAVQELKDEWDAMPGPDWGDYKLPEAKGRALLDEIKHREPLAWEAARRALSVPLPGPRYLQPSYCNVHQHFKWCEHNGGEPGPHGYTAPLSHPAGLAPAPSSAGLASDAQDARAGPLLQMVFEDMEICWDERGTEYAFQDLSTETVDAMVAHFAGVPPRVE